MEHAELSRYERMRRILDQAAVGANASYQGRGPFWQLPLADLLSCELYGVRLIPPATGGLARSAPPLTPPRAPSCCGRSVAEPRTNPSPQADPSLGSGRGAASGLVRGLRGQAPFDGSQFPRLPWGGRPVAAADIAMIEGWIDDGCPEQEGGHGVAIGVAVNPSARAHGLEAHPLATQPVNQLREDHGGPKLRKNVDSLSEDELQRLRAALNEMHRYDAFSLDERGYTYWARIHGNNCQHGWEEFMPWHRLYLYFFELALQDIDASVTVPYWDWSAYYDQDRTATVPDSGVIPPAFRCYVNEAVLQALAPQIPASVQAQLRTTLGRDFNSGLRLLAAAGIEYGRDPAVDDAIFTAITRENPLFYRLRWPGGNNALLFEDYPAPGDIDDILSLTSFFDFGSGPSGNHFYGAIENIHNLIHNFSGGINPRYDPRLPQQNRKEPQYGDMVAPGVTAFDPLFWAHHSNVDRLWAAWQERHPGTGPDNPGAVLPPWPQTVGDTATIARFGYEYARAVQVFPTQPDMSLTRFRSARVSAQPHAPARRVEVRLHGVQHRLQGGSLRVFLNAPHVDEHTQTRDNPHYAGQFHLFAGPCIGGPAHCDVPAARRAGDQRARHRKTPGHLRMDVTQLVQRLRSQGEQELEVQVLALDHAGKPTGDVLRLHSVGLYSFD